VSTLTRVLIRCLSAVFFLLGAIVIPHGAWAKGEQTESSNPALDLAFSIGFVAIPWLIALALARFSTRRN
jgi:hydrogenase/urease accessory protein HupE